MNTTAYTLKVLALTLTLVSTGTVISAEMDPKSGDLKNYLCRDLMRFSGSERDISVGVLQGYLLGKRNTTKYDERELEKLTDQVFDYCLDNPNTVALSAFEKFGK